MTSSSVPSDTPPLTATSESSTTGLGNKCGTATKITLLVVGVLLAAAAVLSFYYGLGTVGSAALMGGSLAAYAAATVTHIVQRRTCISDPSEKTGTAPPSTNVGEEDSEKTGTAPPSTNVGEEDSEKTGTAPPSTAVHESESAEPLPVTEQSSTISLLLKERVIRELDQTETRRGVVLKAPNTDDWNSLDEINVLQKRDTALFFHYKIEDHKKNRYSNIIPFRNNIYKFSTEENPYINASKMLSGECILTQGPLDNTIEDLWNMVWDSATDTVVMATNLTEGYRSKCQPYWPDCPSIPLKYGSITIGLEESEEKQVDGSSALYTIRHLRLKKGAEQRKVRQYHFKDWPDHEVHPSLELISDAITTIDKKHKKGPMIVHCSAGAGRSGVFLACHLLTRLKNHYLSQNKAVEVDIAALVRLLRSPTYGRHMTIMSEKQLQMLYAFGEHLSSKEQS